MDINYGTLLITIYKTDTFVTLVSGNIYNVDTNLFRLAVEARMDDGDGITYLKPFNHNTSVLLGGINYARIIEVINGYTIRFDDNGGLDPWVANLQGSNNNFLDVAVLTTVQIRSNNSAGLINVDEIQQDIFSGGVWRATYGTPAGG